MQYILPARTRCFGASLDVGSHLVILYAPVQAFVLVREPEVVGYVVPLGKFNPTPRVDEHTRVVGSYFGNLAP